jgi:Coenzyme PQQ synthesis protein D (PqqD)
MKVEPTSSSAKLIIEKLPDGSTAIFDPGSQTVYSLNATAGAAWEACHDMYHDTTTLDEVVEAMQASFDPAVTDEIALDALLQLQERGLLRISEAPLQPSRRSMVATAAGVLAPVVLALTGAEQRVFAQKAGSTPTTTATTTSSPTTTPFLTTTSAP